MQAAAQHEDPLLLVLPSNHFVGQSQAFHIAVDLAASLAGHGNLVTFGVVPSRAETGFGYIQAGGCKSQGGHAVARFVEKPDSQTAQDYLDQGGYYWNSGMFMFRSSVYLKELQAHRPDILVSFQQAMAQVVHDLDFSRVNSAAFAHCSSKSIDYAVMEKHNMQQSSHWTQGHATDIKKFVDILKQQGRTDADTHRQVFRPWGSYDAIDEGHRFKVKRIVVKPGQKLSLQMHHHHCENWIVVSGTALVTVDGQERLLSENESTYIPLGRQDRLENPGKVDLHLIKVQSGSYLGENDIVPFEDTYGRVAD